MIEVNRGQNKMNKREGIFQKSVTGARYIFYKQIGGNSIRLDVFDNKKISDVEEFKNYDIVESSDEYNPDSEVTKYYLLPKKGEIKYYTDSTGITYKTSSMYVYTDKKGNYRSFSDDTKLEIERCQRNLELFKKQLERDLNSNLGDESKSIELYRKLIVDNEKRLIKLNKELSKGM